MESFDALMDAYEDDCPSREGFRTRFDLKWAYDRFREQIEQLEAERDTALNATYKEINRLRLKVCTCPWPEDAERSRHLMGCPAWPDEREMDEGIFNFLIRRVGIGRALEIDRASTHQLATKR